MSVDALQEMADCIKGDGLSLRLLSVGRRCKQHGYRFCWEPWADEPTFQIPEGKLIDVEVDNYVPHILSSCSPPSSNKERCRVKCVPGLAPAWAEKQAGALEDDDELQLASACENAEAVRSGTSTAPELKSEGGLG